MGELNNSNIKTKYTIDEVAAELCISVYKLKYYINNTDYQANKDTNGNIEFTSIDIQNLRNQMGMNNTYSISQAAKKIDIPVYKIRYFLERTNYEIARDKMGNREFTEVDLINIKKLMELRKSSISYEAIGNFILRGNPIDPEASEDLEPTVENKDKIEELDKLSITSLQQPESINVLASTIMEFQCTIEHFSDKLEKLDVISEKLDGLASSDNITNLKEEVKSYFDENQQLIEQSNSEIEQKVSNMSLELKEVMAKRREQVLKEKQKSIFSRIFHWFRYKKT